MRENRAPHQRQLASHLHILPHQGLVVPPSTQLPSQIRFPRAALVQPVREAPILGLQFLRSRQPTAGRQLGVAQPGGEGVDGGLLLGDEELELNDLSDVGVLLLVVPSSGALFLPRSLSLLLGLRVLDLLVCHQVASRVNRLHERAARRPPPPEALRVADPRGRRRRPRLDQASHPLPALIIRVTARARPPVVLHLRLLQCPESLKEIARVAVVRLVLRLGHFVGLLVPLSGLLALPRVRHRLMFEPRFLFRHDLAQKSTAILFFHLLPSLSRAPEEFRPHPLRLLLAVGHQRDLGNDAQVVPIAVDKGGDGRLALRGHVRGDPAPLHLVRVLRRRLFRYG
mmetsp:Transcript_55171/g.117251  ORF Transcript_55171/g.117251 Transcript_55171/m.117251 type:complete len:341 (-) Transcript_55171:274-1296(-)